MIPYRLILMYSVYEDSVLDPFWGTGTTTLAAMAAGRHSVGVELDGSFDERFVERVDQAESITSELVRGRLNRHEPFVTEAREGGDEVPHQMEWFDLPVKTAQETELRPVVIEDIERNGSEYRVTHRPLSRSE